MQEPLADLLNAWRAKGKFGLTIPFVFGGLRLHPLQPLGHEDDLKTQFENMLELISKDGADGEFVRLAYCDNAKDLILAPTHRVPELCKQVTTSDGHRLLLWIQHDIENVDVPTLVNVTNALWAKYGEDISNGNYSRRDGNYHPFDDADTQLLTKAFNNRQ